MCCDGSAPAPSSPLADSPRPGLAPICFQAAAAAPAETPDPAASHSTAGSPSTESCSPKSGCSSSSSSRKLRGRGGGEAVGRAVATCTCRGGSQGSADSSQGRQVASHQHTAEPVERNAQVRPSSTLPYPPWASRFMHAPLIVTTHTPFTHPAPPTPGPLHTDRNLHTHLLLYESLQQADDPLCNGCSHARLTRPTPGHDCHAAHEQAGWGVHGLHAADGLRSGVRGGGMRAGHTGRTGTTAGSQTQ